MSWRWLHQVAVAVDQFANAVLGGYADETLSARMHRGGTLDDALGVRGRWWYARALVDWLFTPQDWLVRRRGEWTGARHCERAYHAELQRLQYPHPYRNNQSSEAQ